MLISLISPNEIKQYVRNALLSELGNTVKVNYM
jgi:hypothetical protein